MTTIRTTDEPEIVRDALGRAFAGQNHFTDRDVLQRLIADLDTQIALTSAGIVVDPVKAALDARRAHDRAPDDTELERVFNDAESRLSDDQFHEYLDRYRKQGSAR